MCEKRYEAPPAHFGPDDKIDPDKSEPDTVGSPIGGEWHTILVSVPIRSTMATEHEKLVEEMAAIWLLHDWDVSSLETAMEMIAQDRNSEHSGDCTKQPWTCMRCTMDDALKVGGEIATLVEAAFARRIEEAVAVERKACAKVAERGHCTASGCIDRWTHSDLCPRGIAAAIRARGDHDGN